MNSSSKKFTSTDTSERPHVWGSTDLGAHQSSNNHPASVSGEESHCMGQEPYNLCMCNECFMTLDRDLSEFLSLIPTSDHDPSVPRTTTSYFPPTEAKSVVDLQYPGSSIKRTTATIEATMGTTIGAKLARKPTVPMRAEAPPQLPASFKLSVINRVTKPATKKASTKTVSNNLQLQVEKTLRASQESDNESNGLDVVSSYTTVNSPFVLDSNMDVCMALDLSMYPSSGRYMETDMASAFEPTLELQMSPDKLVFEEVYSMFDLPEHSMLSPVLEKAESDSVVGSQNSLFLEIRARTENDGNKIAPESNEAEYTNNINLDYMCEFFGEGANEQESMAPLDVFHYEPQEGGENEEQEKVEEEKEKENEQDDEDADWDDSSLFGESSPSGENGESVENSVSVGNTGSVPNTDSLFSIENTALAEFPPFSELQIPEGPFPQALLTSEKSSDEALPESTGAVPCSPTILSRARKVAFDIPPQELKRPATFFPSRQQLTPTPHPITTDSDQKKGVPRKSKRRPVDESRYVYGPNKIEQWIEPGARLHNSACNEERDGCSFRRKSVRVFDRNHGLNAIARVRYVRNMDDFALLGHGDMKYDVNSSFSRDDPYQQQCTRLQWSNHLGDWDNQTRAGLCAYCEKISFYELKNLSYAQHLAHLHGIDTDGFLIPDPLYAGVYFVAKETGKDRTTTAQSRQHKCVVCPACYLLKEVACWEDKEVEVEETDELGQRRIRTEKRLVEPLTSYFRHFKDEHRVVKKWSSWFGACVPEMAEKLSLRAKKPVALS